MVSVILLRQGFRGQAQGGLPGEGLAYSSPNEGEGEVGGIAQLAEHELCKLGVTGSIPVASTSLRPDRAARREACEERRLRAGVIPSWRGMRRLAERPRASTKAGKPAYGRVAQSVRAHP